MLIELQRIIPFPLQETSIEDSQIWERDISFESGKHYLISAISGKGKTTFVHCICGLRKDYTGNVPINKTTISDISQSELLNWRKDKFSIVPQALVLFDKLSFLENIQLKNRLTNFKSIEQIKAMAEMLGMTPYLHQKAQTLSFGQKQRLAIIRSLCQPFDFLLLDEPFSHLDVSNIHNAWTLIKKEVQEQNAGIILTSLGNKHNISFNKTILL